MSEIDQWNGLATKILTASLEATPDKFIELLKGHRVGRPGGMPVDHGPRPDADNPEHYPDTLLFDIASNKKPAAVVMAKALIHLGADLNVMSNGGDTPLISAANAGAAGMVRLLLESGADVHARASPARNERKSVIGSFLMTTPSPEDSEILDTLMSFGASLKDLGTGSTAMMHAIQRNSPERVRFLLAQGEDPTEPSDPKDPGSMSSVEYAFKSGYSDLTPILQAWLDARSASQAIDEVMNAAKAQKEQKSGSLAP